ncbi:multidrug ABC transporter ATP-binding protein [Micromonospora parathelypteridis]|uniref:ABC-2 type transport system ATP-binding protein n=2 Tax=Micromonospora parathelypteridis TaxID=1839617 RepID=A0A840VX72_9ACTN|nr:ABC-2 type transport system ATP-binding protein [Micromonospora parathelypteridis]GGO19006.1 multidrug ABC transporter ATP-binding protein [Micromonospora parathelypteridis]
MSTRVASAVPATAETTVGPEQPAVRVRGLRMAYGEQEVLRGIDLTVDRGEIVALLGPNGAGKSTTIEILEGFRLRSAGEVSVLGVDPAHGDEAWRARLGIVLQSWRDHAKWQARELLLHFRSFYRPYDRPGAAGSWEVDDLLDVVGLTEQARKPIGTLSGGQRRRLDIAIGIVGRPEVLFLDEPTVGFDPEARQDFHELIRRLAQERMTVLLTTHDLHEAEKLADRVLILAGGGIVAGGTVEELSRQLGGDAEVTWVSAGRTHRTRTADVSGFVRELLQGDGDVEDLRVNRPALEDIYLAMVRDAEGTR